MRLATIFFLTSLLGSSQTFKGYIPPATIHISGNLFIDASEVSNIAWREFEHHVSSNKFPGFEPYSHPNTEVTKLYRPGYYSNAKFKYHPIVGIELDQARAYCAWKTLLINGHLKEMYEHEALSHQLEVRYRLPTEQEWELSTTLIDTLVMTTPYRYRIADFLDSKNEQAIKILIQNDSLDSRRIRKLYRNHIKNDSVPYYKVDYSRPPFAILEDRLPENIYFPEWDGTLSFTEKIDKPLNLIGNVAELVQEAGITKGGSWRHNLAVSFPAKRILIDPKKVYDWVGFRCICEVWEISE